jgi:hypothetical protein
MGLRCKRTPEQMQAFSEVLKRGGTLTEAKLAAGYSRSVALRGLDQMPKEMLALYRKGPLQRLAELGKEYKPAERADMVRGAMLDNLITGKDKAVASAKLLAQDREVNLLVPESQMGVIVLQTSERSDRLLVEASEVDK